ncbi:universal stress protein [Kitasatospora sp. GAS204B]|uniref:universal stress protein n=1 Tax=unclassified Kitasatospora TaxID=2633591 RepID=UPI002476F25A|nr:universal stress protein [Kitasatospora sp. GAS204B]MDH6117794.1 nucleotide-binding universal stress UspA family protein [Kitasatospora sp. GAS204B]
MHRSIVAGLDGSAESLAAAHWAAREARRSGRPLTLVQVWPPRILGKPADQDAKDQGQRLLDDVAAELRAGHPEAEITATQVLDDRPSAVLTAASGQAGLLVLGSRGLSGLRGFLLGSVSQSVLGQAGCPVVLVRAGGEGPDGRPAGPDDERPVALGVDFGRPCDAAVRFAFEAAAERSVGLHAVHAWSPVASYGPSAFPVAMDLNTQLTEAETQALADLMRPWREKYPQVEVVEQVLLGSAGWALLEAVPHAGLVVIGRHPRQLPVGEHLGPVAHAVVHHAPCPVAVVPCG